MKKIAFIGGGVMGTALSTSACRGIDPSEVIVTDIVKEKAQKLAEDLGCVYVETNEEAVTGAEYLLFAVKPQFLEGVLDGVKPAFEACRDRGEKKVIISIAAGVEVQTYYDVLGLSREELSVIRILPNTACLIGKGFTIIEQRDTYTKEQEDEFKYILRESGGFESLPPNMFTAGCILTSTSPCIIAMFANSLADGAVYNGLLRPQARKLALEGINCAIQLFLSGDKHLEQYKDEVCSPGGPAMYAVKELEDRGFRSSVINAVKVAYERFDTIGKIK